MDLDTLEKSSRQESLAQILRDAFVHHRAGETDEASRAYRQILEKDPQYSDARYLLGLVAAQKRDYVTAIAHLQATVQQVPGNLDYRRSLAEAYLASGDLDQAKISFQEIRKMAPDDFQSAFQLGRLALMQKKYDAAVLQYRTALGLNPKSAECYSDLGKIMLELKDAPAAEQFFKIALGLQADLIEAQCNLGNALRKQNRFAEAIEVYQRVLTSDAPLAQMNSYYWQVLNNLALSFLQSGNSDAAVQCYREAIAREPENALLHTNFAYLLLSLGQFQEGWAEHEWRWKMAGFSTKLRDFQAPLWRGESLEGATILLHCEQGMGDTLQFVRYASLVAAREGKVILEVQPRLRTLLSSLPGVSQVISRGEELPAFDYHCPLMSLPLLFGTTVDTIPAHARYLSISEEEVAYAKQKWAGEGIRVGLAWAGNPDNPHDALRSMSLKQLFPLGKTLGVTFYSLQFGPAADQVITSVADLPILDACSKDESFAETAALVAGLDLVITVDTAIAHLAGALGIPAWIMLPHSRSDWRWLYNREDSPWYPSARLFRQDVPDDWTGAVEKVRQELHKFANR